MKTGISRTNINNIVLILISLYLCSYYSILKENEKRSAISSRATSRRGKVRKPWSYVDDILSDRQFRRMFRMTRECFDLLVDKIKISIGEKRFKSESYIDCFLNHPGQMQYANVRTTGGFISGETKLGITLRLLAGGDALDLGLIFDISSNWCLVILYEVLQEWLVDTKIGGIDIKSYLNNEDAMAAVSEGFSKRSNGVLKGAIGALDGWLVRIQRPSYYFDKITNPVAFFSRKGFYALNVQCIVDHNKKILWASYKHKGGSHDSTAFRNGKLYEVLKEKAQYLSDKEYFILGDSAYAIESFLIPPYPLAKPNTPEDNFNFYHSSARITVECAFGEIDLRWGIFWKRLKYALTNNFLIIEGAMRIHNFLVDYRNNELEDIRTDLSEDFAAFVSDNTDDDAIVPGVILNDNCRPSGRISDDERTRRNKGIEIRDKLKLSLADHNMHRPKANKSWSVDENNHTIRNE